MLEIRKRRTVSSTLGEVRSERVSCLVVCKCQIPRDNTNGHFLPESLMTVFALVSRFVVLESVGISCTVPPLASVP